MRAAWRSRWRWCGRWFATILTAALLLAWGSSAWWIEASLTERAGVVGLRTGCLDIGYPVEPTLPTNLHVQAFVPWPAADYGFRWASARETGVRWWVVLPGDRFDITFPGTVETTISPTGSPSTTTASSASFRRHVLVPLWPLALLAGLTSAWMWRAQRRAREPGQCRKCGYDRRGLAADAKCPECGTGPARG